MDIQVGDGLSQACIKRGVGKRIVVKYRRWLVNRRLIESNDILVASCTDGEKSGKTKYSFHVLCSTMFGMPAIGIAIARIYFDHSSVHVTRLSESKTPHPV